MMLLKVLVLLFPNEIGRIFGGVDTGNMEGNVGERGGGVQ